MMARQLILDLGHQAAQSRADFLVTQANAIAVATLDRPEHWPQGRMLLIGPDGSGKSHLASIWATDTGARRIAAAQLRVETADEIAVPGGAICVEDADRAGDYAGTEQALFHLWNLAAERDCWLLLTARQPPRYWGLTLPDLLSRMGAMSTAQIEAPDEALLAAVLVKLFSDRQITVSSSLIDWLVLRMDRDLGQARRLVAALDAEALAGGRPLTRSLAAEAFGRLDNADEDSA